MTERMVHANGVEFSTERFGDPADAAILFTHTSTPQLSAKGGTFGTVAEAIRVVCSIRRWSSWLMSSW